MAAELLPWASQSVGIGGGSSDAPALCARGDRLYAVWKGVHNDHRLFWSSFDGNAWSPQQAGVGGGSSAGPSLAVYQHQLFAAWKGTGDDERMFWSSFDGSGWSPQRVGIGGGSNEAPAIAAFQNRLFAVWKGAGNDQRMFWSSFDGHSWTPQQLGVGGGTSRRPALAVFKDRLYAAWKGAGSDERMFWSSFDGTVWSPQQLGVGGGSAMGPSLAVYAVGLPGVDDRLFAAWRGANGDERMFWSMFDGASWTGQQPGIGGGTSHRPSLATFGKKLFAAWKGAANDERLFWSSLNVDRMPLQPMIVSPPVGATNQPIRPRLAWRDPGAGTIRAAESFFVEVSTPEHPLYDAWVARGATTLTNYTVGSDLGFGGSYIWRVTPLNGLNSPDQLSGKPADGKFSVQQAATPPPPQPTCMVEDDADSPPSDTISSKRIYGGYFQGGESIDIIEDDEVLTTTAADRFGLYSVPLGFFRFTTHKIRAQGTSGRSSPDVRFYVL